MKNWIDFRRLWNETEATKPIFGKQKKFFETSCARDPPLPDRRSVVFLRDFNLLIFSSFLYCDRQAVRHLTGRQASGWEKHLQTYVKHTLAVKPPRQRLHHEPRRFLFSSRVRRCLARQTLAPPKNCSLIRAITLIYPPWRLILEAILRREEISG